MAEIKLIAFDLDGTLTQHKEALTREHREVLDRLGQRYRLVMAGAGQTGRIFRQMGEYPIDIIKIDREILLLANEERGKKLFFGIKIIRKLFEHFNRRCHVKENSLRAILLRMHNSVRVKPCRSAALLKRKKKLHP